MATMTWIGNAGDVAQVDYVTIQNAEEGDIFRLICNNKTITVVTGEGETEVHIIDAFVDAIEASDFPEFAEITADAFTQPNGTYTLRLTAAEAGKPFTVTVDSDNGSALGIGITTIQAASSGRNEKQIITLAGTPTGGTFTLTYSGQTTGAIAYNASAATVQTALEGLSNIAVGDVTVTDNSGGGWLVEFTGTLAGDDVALITGNGASLTGQTGYITHNTTTQGSTGSNEVQVWTLEYLQPSSNAYSADLFTENSEDGTLELYRLTVSSNIAFAPTAAQVRAMLEHQYGTGNVSVTRTLTSTVATYTITWQGDYAGVDIASSSFDFLPEYTEADDYWTIGTSTTTEGSATPVDEIQTFTINHTPTGGTFTLTYSGQTTSALNYNATAAEVETALEALSNITAVAVTKSGPVYTITFTDPGDQNIEQLTSTSSLTGSRVNVVVEQEASEAIASKVGVSLSGAPTGGTFSLLFFGAETSALDYDSTAQEIEDAINALVSPERYGGAAASTDPGSAEPSWNNPANALTAAATYADVTLGIDEASAYLDIDTYGFAVPTDAVITGAQIKVIAHQTLATVVTGIRVTLLDAAGAPGAFNEDEAATLLVEDTPTEYTIGTTTANFGLTLTPAMVNDADFGSRLQIVSGGAGGGSAYIQNVRILIHFTVDGVAFTQEVDVTGSDGGPWIVEGDAGGTNLDLAAGDNNLTSSGNEGITLTNHTASTGKHYWSAAANWSGNSVPATGDTVWLMNSDVSILYGLAQSAVTLAALNHDMSFTGSVGLPDNNEEGYREYRDKELAISVTALNLGLGDGDGSSLIRINMGSNVWHAIVHDTGGSDDEFPAVLLRGSHADSTLKVMSGSVGVAVFGGETSTLTSLQMSAGGDGAGPTVRLGSGVTLSGNLTKQGGTLECYCSIGGNFLQTAGDSTFYGTAAITGTSEIQEGTVNWRSAGSLTGNVDVAGGGTLAFGEDHRGRTVAGTVVLHAGATLLDPHRSVTWSNPIQLKQCRLEDVTVDFGTDVSLVVASL